MAVLTVAVGLSFILGVYCGVVGLLAHQAGRRSKERGE